MARSAAILLISSHIAHQSHISAANKNNSQRNSDEKMKKHLQKQLKHQRQQLHLELPPNTAHILTKLLKRGLDNCDDELNSLGNGTIEMGALPSPACETARVAVKLLISCQFKNFFFKKKTKQQKKTNLNTEIMISLIGAKRHERKLTNDYTQINEQTNKTNKNYIHNMFSIIYVGTACLFCYDFCYVCQLHCCILYM